MKQLLNKIQHDTLMLHVTKKKSSDEYKIATIMIAALHIGAIENKIADALQLERHYVEMIGRFLRKLEIWLEGETSKTVVDYWSEFDDGAILFLVSVKLAIEEINRMTTKSKRTSIC